MNYREYMKEILEKAKLEFEEAEVYLSRSKSLEIQIFEGEIIKYNIAESTGLSLRGILDGKMGYSYTERLDNDLIDELVEKAVDSSKYIDKLEGVIYEGSKVYEESDVFLGDLEEVDIDKKIELVKNLEKEIKKYEFVDKTMTGYEEVKTDRYILNTKGVDLYDRANYGLIGADVIAKKGEEVKTSFNFKKSNKFSDFNYKELAKEAVDKAVGKFGGEQIKSGNYPVVFENETFANLLASFSSVFIADSVQKDMSLLKGKLGKKIASPLITLVDDPFLEDGYGSRDFDDEGMSTIFTEVIEDGVLRNYLYNWETANKDGVESTGNAERNYKSSMGTGVTNFYITEGENTKEELLLRADNGVYIDDLQGLHSGLNPVSGDFSLSAGGYVIENGEIKKPIKEITVAGNFFEVLENTVGVGNDLKFPIFFGSKIGSPTIYVKTLAISGK